MIPDNVPSSYMDVVIALDFDGTLYPITDYDSEQLLLHLSGREGAEELIERDKKGGFDPVSFNADFERIIQGLEESYIDEAVRILHCRCADEDFSPLRRLQAKGCHIAIVSCGSDLLISRFLALAGLEAEMIVAKEMITEDGKISKVKSHINDIREKEHAVRRIRERWPDCSVIAVGDGPTDAYMLRASDYPFVISYNGRRRLEGYEIIDSFSRVEEVADSILQL